MTQLRLDVWTLAELSLLDIKTSFISSPLTLL